MNHLTIVKMIKGKTYKERHEHQLKKWVEGEYIHNDVDDECCPDFACCNDQMRTSKEKREQFKRVYDEQGSEGVVALLGEFLGEAISKHQKKTGEKNIVKIIGDYQKKN